MTTDKSKNLNSLDTNTNTIMNNTNTNMMTVNDIEFWVSKRPILYYAVSILADNGKGRKMWTSPISMECEDADVRIDNVSMGETIIACVPAVAGSYEVFVEWSDGGLIEDVSIGMEVPGADHSDWDYIAKQYIKRVVCDTC